ncbi:sigma-70 family RNA polymerase sigma factor [Flavihumibacter sp. CACIAM 22H1]|uniref:RNA polymerase sigma factor n=1 Tax=Flavihumibacter sp. CACIAM 22H1 TaxID=1812911 RepID=UPI0025C2A7D4|nr:sigma-70 family RNA polymerase sigma factor [Flavihumibacter sp. CACIAM 22H1]
MAKSAAAGDEEAFKQLYEAISGKMYSICLRYAGNKSDANDWYQDGFIKLINNLSYFRGEGSFEGWARKVFIGICIDNLKKKILPVVPIEADLNIAISDSVYDKLSMDDLFRIIQQLPDFARTIINLSLIEGYNHKEIAEILNISEEGSRSQLFRARQLMKKTILFQNGTK